MQLVAVRADLPGALYPDSGVVDQDIEAFVVASNRLGELPDLGHRCQVSRVEPRAALAALDDVLHHRGAALGVASVDDDVRAERANPACHFAAEAVRGSADPPDLPCPSTTIASFGRLPQARPPQSLESCHS